MTSATSTGTYTAVQQANHGGGTAIQIGGPVIADAANALGFDMRETAREPVVLFPF